MQSIVLGGGCFWCTEAAFQIIKGVSRVTPGYSGGSVPDPDYYAVATGKTGHAEVVKVDFDPSIISLKQLLDVFWTIHDPTTLNRQGPDVGTDYRSVILFSNEDQQEIIETSVEEAQKLWSDPIVTEVKPLDHFYEAESEHHDFYLKKTSQFYCDIVINPKLQKLREQNADLLVS